jgi:hypothetical protein
VRNAATSARTKRLFSFHRAAAVAAAIGCLLTAAAAGAHSVQPRDVLAKLQSPGLRARFDIVSVAPDAKLARLVLIRVGPKWHDVPVDQRINAAEQWQHLWRDSMPGGIVAIIDAARDTPLVNFDTAGHATLKKPVRRGGEDDRPTQ